MSNLPNPIENGTGKRIDDGGPAFPTDSEAQVGNSTWHMQGMSLRDYFAASAMQGWITNDANEEGCVATTPEGVERERYMYALDVAKSAYRYADAMIAARKAGR